MNKVQKLFSAGSAIALLFVQVGASATTYPGAICQQESGGALAHYGGTIFNNSSTSDMTVICPFDKASKEICDGTFIEVFNRSPTVPFSCTMVQELVTGSDVFNWQVTNTTPHGAFGSNAQAISFGFANAAANYYYAVCTVPRVAPGNLLSHVAFLNIVDCAS